MKPVILLFFVLMSGFLLAEKHSELKRVPITVMPGSHFPKSYSQSAFEHAGIDGKRPILFKGAALSWPVMSKWNLNRLKKEFGRNEVTVNFVDYYDSGYVVGNQKMLLEEHLEDIEKNQNSSGYYIDLNYYARLLSPTRVYNSTGHIPYAGIAGLLADETLFPTLYKKCEMFVGGKTKSALHGHDGIFFLQIEGIKKAYFLSPDDDDSIYKEDFVRRSYVDLEKPDLIKYPLIEKATIYEVVVRPGDVLYFPDEWLHTFHAVVAPSISLACEFPSWVLPSELHK